MHVVVIGGGIAGLAAAHRLLAGGARVTVLEASARLGGKLLAGEIAGAPSTSAPSRCSPAARRRSNWPARSGSATGSSRPPPPRAVDLDARRAAPDAQGPCDGRARRPGRARAACSPTRGSPASREDATCRRTEVGDDVAVGEYVAARLGREVVDRLVEPLLGGVYAGDAYRISMRAAVPQLFEAARDAALAARRRTRASRRRPPPRRQTGAGLHGHRGRHRAAARSPSRTPCAPRGGEILTGTPVPELRRRGRRRAAGGIAADDRGAATPTRVVARRARARGRAALLRRRVPRPRPPSWPASSTPPWPWSPWPSAARTWTGCPDGSGFLVPPVDGRTIKASTFSTHKWGWVADAGPGPVRAAHLRRPVRRGRRSCTATTPSSSTCRCATSARRPDWPRGPSSTGSPAGTADCRSTRSAITRAWPGSATHVAKLPGLAVCGAAYDGVGIPACIASAHAPRTSCDLRQSRPSRGRAATAARENRRHDRCTAEKASRTRARRPRTSTRSSATPCGPSSSCATSLPEDRAGYADEVQELFDQLAAKDVTVRGTYDVSGLRADADLMIWWHAETADELQEAYNLFRRTRLGRALEPVWSNMALHRPAEFNKSHIPAFLADEDAARLRQRLPLRALLRLVPAARRGPPPHARRPRQDGPRLPRRARQHGASFSLGDYEWILAFEADELYRIVDLMRHLRGSEARMHVREEVPVLHGPAQARRRAGGRAGLTPAASLHGARAACRRVGLRRPARRAVGLRFRRGPCGALRCAARRLAVQQVRVQMCC